MTTHTLPPLPAAVLAPDTAVLQIQASDADALFEDGTPPTYPHLGRMLNPKLATYLEALAREQRRSPSVELLVDLHSPALRSEEENRVRRQIQAYFAEERQLAELELRVNQKEGWGFLRSGRVVVVLAVAIGALVFLAQPDLSSASLGVFLAALLYLLFIAVVWVILWDPIEKLIYDAFLLRARLLALTKLGAASIRFAYPHPPPTAG